MSTNPPLLNWCGETLTATYPNPAAAASAVARRRIQAPIGVICPVSSATGTKFPGDSSPSFGCRQRTSASNPATRAGPCSCTIGW